MENVKNKFQTLLYIMVWVIARKAKIAIKCHILWTHKFGK